MKEQVFNKSQKNINKKQNAKINYCSLSNIATSIFNWMAALCKKNKWKCSELSTRLHTGRESGGEISSIFTRGQIVSAIFNLTLPGDEEQ